MSEPASRFSNTVATGIRVSLNTQAPLRRSGTLSTAWHCDQSSIDVTMINQRIQENRRSGRPRSAVAAIRQRPILPGGPRTGPHHPLGITSQRRKLAASTNPEIAKKPSNIIPPSLRMYRKLPLTDHINAALGMTPTTAASPTNTPVLFPTRRRDLIHRRSGRYTGKKLAAHANPVQAAITSRSRHSTPLLSPPCAAARATYAVMPLAHAEATIQATDSGLSTRCILIDPMATEEPTLRVDDRRHKQPIGGA